MEVIILIAVLIVAIMYSTLSWALVLYKFHIWFLPIIYTGITLTYIQCIAIHMLIVAIMAKSGSKYRIKDTGQEITPQFSPQFAAPWITLFIGWVVTWFI